MKALGYGLSLLLLGTSVAHADQVTVTINQAAEIYNGLLALDGYDEAVKDGERQKPIRKNYSLSGPVRLAIAKDLVRVKDIVSTFAMTRDKMREDDPKGWEKQVAAMSNETQTLDLVRFNSNELQLSVNPVPPSVLANLGPILIGD